MAKVSELFVRALKKSGVDLVFGIPSIHNIGLYDALRDEPSIKHILCRHESSATHLADGYARAGKGVGVVITSTGPGAGYMVAPLVEAWGSSSPVLAVTTNIAVDKIGRGMGTLHELKDQDHIFRSITKERFCLRTGDDVQTMVSQAVQTALSGRPGPVYCEVPTDLWDREVTGGGEDVPALEPAPSLERWSGDRQGVVDYRLQPSRGHRSENRLSGTDGGRRDRRRRFFCTGPRNWPPAAATASAFPWSWSMTGPTG